MSIVISAKDFRISFRVIDLKEIYRKDMMNKFIVPDYITTIQKTSIK